MKKSKEPSIRIKRAVKQLKEANDIFGNTLFEQIIAVGVAETENQLEYLKSQNKRSIIKPQIYEDVISILRDNLEQMYELTHTE